jgi:hypothetical protein
MDDWIAGLMDCCKYSIYNLLFPLCKNKELKLNTIQNTHAKNMQPFPIKMQPETIAFNIVS